MHGVSCQLRLPQHQLINKWHHDKTAPKTKEHRGDTGSKACQCNNCDIVQENIPDLKMSEQLIPVASCFPFAQRSITFVNRSDGDRCAQRKN
ncbi:hypothetical protein BvCmsKSNP073_05327 [Escherichia coli]|nr:hypothetical protein BvCmsKSNP073_05327 [Escherichia coli]